MDAYRMAGIHLEIEWDTIPHTIFACAVVPTAMQRCSQRKDCSQGKAAAQVQISSSSSAVHGLLAQCAASRSNLNTGNLDRQIVHGKCKHPGPDACNVYGKQCIGLACSAPGWVAVNASAYKQGARREQVGMARCGDVASRSRNICKPCAGIARGTTSLDLLECVHCKRLLFGCRAR